MAEHKLQFLISAFSNQNVHISDDGIQAVILNPFCDENITVYYYEEDDFTPFCACFSFQHSHLTDEEDVIGWIGEIISGSKLAIEFFNHDDRRFGGEITAEELEDLSYAMLEQFTGYYGLTKLLNLADSFKIRGWNPGCNFDGVFAKQGDGTVLIEKKSLKSPNGTN